MARKLPSATVALIMTALMALPVSAQEGDATDLTICPKDAYEAFYEGTVTGEAPEDRIAVELAMLRRCLERTKLIRALLDETTQIEKIQSTATSGNTEPAATASTTGTSEESVGIFGEGTVPEISTDTQSTASIQPVQAAPAPEPYTWFTMMGVKDDVTAGIARGDRTWFVKVGDELPGGVVITKILGRPVTVQVRDQNGPQLLGFRHRP